MSLRSGIGFKTDKAHLDLLINGSWFLPACIISGVILLSNQKPERGYLIYEQQDGTLSKGPTIIGDLTSVEIPLKVPPGAKPKALFHTHSGSLTPSEQDLKTSAKYGLPLFIECGDEVECFSAVRGNK
jgi:hypothetical protein